MTLFIWARYQLLSGLYKIDGSDKFHGFQLKTNWQLLDWPSLLYFIKVSFIFSMWDLLSSTFFRDNGAYNHNLVEFIIPLQDHVLFF